MSQASVFKAYDIRGRTDNGDLNADLFHEVGNVFARMVGGDTIAVGRDCRASSDELFDGLVEGIIDAGVDVVDLGEVPTDLVYFYSGKNDVPGAIITASHNPPQYNGLKLCRSGAAPVGAESGLRTIEEEVSAGRTGRVDRPGTVSRVDAVDDYVDHLLGVVDPKSIGALRVAVDGGNGMAGITVRRVFDRLEASLDGLYLEPDGTFPNHPADPIQVENLRDLVTMVREGGHDLGVAFDGDADRAFFIDETAEPVNGSAVTALIARWMLKRHPGASIIHNLITSRAVPELVRQAGGTPVRTRVGHSFIKAVMAETGAVFGGEHSGHYYFADNYRADSGMLAMLILLRVVSEEGRPLSALVGEVEIYRQSGEINFEVTDAAEAMAAVEGEFEDASIDRLDGLSVDAGNFWFNVRPSNTEPLVRLNVEARDQASVDEAVAKIRAVIEGAR
ncbi:MAG: phosphomannomutase/phosphoglucomutase [Acidimicrobiia bacterium]